MHMNDLRLFLERVSDEISLLSTEASFESEKLYELQKPWLVKTPGSKSSLASSSKGACGDATAEEERRVRGEVEKADNLLKQARHIRLSQERKLKSAEEPRNSGKRRQVGKTSSARHNVAQNSSKKSDTLANKSLQPASKVSSRVKQIKDPENVDQKLAIAASASSEKPDREYLDFRDIVKERSLPSKYIKLRHMHNRLAQTLTKCDVGRVPCEAGTNFMLKFYNIHESKAEDTKSENEWRRITPHTVKISIPRAISRCQNLTNSLNYKIAYSTSTVTPSSLYYQQLVYSDFSRAAIDLENFLDTLNKMSLLNAALFDENLVHFLHDLETYHMPCSFLTFENEREVRRNATLLHDLNWMKWLGILKQKIHDVIMLQQGFNSTESVENPSLNREIVKCLTTAYGLLAKKHRCCINPAVVLYD